MAWAELIPWIAAGIALFMWYNERNRRIKAEIHAKITSLREALNVIQKDIDKNKPEYQSLAMLLELKSLDDIIASLGAGSAQPPDPANSSEGKTPELDRLREDVQPIRGSLQGEGEIVGITRNRVGQIIGGQDSGSPTPARGVEFREEEK